MANSKQAKKRVRQNDKRRHHNRALRSRMRTAIKSVHAAIEGGNKETAKTAFIHAQRILDNSWSKGLIHRNKASRLKSRMQAQIKDLA